MKSPTSIIEQLTISFNYYTQDIDDVLAKEFLITAIISHLTKDTDLPKEVVTKFVHLVYLTDHC